MPLQTTNLSMTGLGMLKDFPINHRQPKLKPGIHLRWAFKREIGFPWHGYFLLRRKHPGEINLVRCLGLTKDPYITGSVTTNFFSIPRVLELYSDTGIPLVNGDPLKIDMQDRSYLGVYFLDSPAHNIKVTLLFTASASIEIRCWVLAGGATPFHKENVSGKAGETRVWELSFDCIGLVQIGGGMAVVEDICYALVSDDVYKSDWQTIKTFTYPYALPVAFESNMAVSNPFYPCFGKPGNYAEAKKMAADRIHYDDPAAPRMNHFKELERELERLVNGGPPSVMSDKKYINSAGSGSYMPKPIKMPSIYHIDLVCTGALNPAIAQMIGLYFIDDTVVEKTAYDYLIIADHDGKLSDRLNRGIESEVITIRGSEIKTLLSLPGMDGWVTYNKKLHILVPLSPPADTKVYALPGITVRDEETGLITNSDKRNSAGLTWQVGLQDMNILLPEKAIMYELWRKFINNEEAEPVAKPDTETYDLASPTPLVIGNTMPASAPPVPQPSPFPPFRILAFDNYLADGWYSYLINGIDLFGRYSDYSLPASWHQWSAMPKPKPWYYQLPADNRQLHAFAARLLDTIGPPPPTAIEASALDPEDPYVVRDAAYNNWFAALPASQKKVVGLRVKWQWTLYHMRQAPNTLAFVIYPKNGSFNLYQGKIVVSTPGAATIDITIDQSVTTGTLVDKLIQIGPNSYPVIANSGSVVTIDKVTQIFNPNNGYIIKLDNTDKNNWGAAVKRVNYDSHVSFFIRTMTDKTGKPLAGSANAVLSGTNLQLPATTDLTYARRNIEQVEITDTVTVKKEIVEITDINHVTNLLTLKNIPAVVTSSLVDWNIGLLIRQYEIFFPDTAGVMSGGIPSFDVSLANPTHYYNIGVSTIEKKSLSEQEGNVGGPSKIYRVWRAKPAPPVPLPPDSEKIFASPADYYGNSYYTYRWMKQVHLRTHIYRAMDETLFGVDFDWRKISAFVLKTGDSQYFPPEPAFTALKKTLICEELNKLNANAASNAGNKSHALAAYRTLSNDGLRILAGLPGNQRAFQQITIQPLDPDDPANANKPGPDNPMGYVLDPNPSIKAWIDKLPGKGSNRFFYRAAYADPVQNISPMSLSTAPIWLPDVSAPAAPMITKNTKR